MIAWLKRHEDAMTVLAFLPLAAAILLWLLTLSGTELASNDRYEIQAVVPSSDALSPPAEVRIDGIEVGHVAEVAPYGPQGGSTLLLLSLDAGNPPVFRNARVRVRLRTLVGENYVEIDPGTPAAGLLAENGTLGIDRAAEYVASDEVFSVFNARRRDQLRAQLRSFGGAVQDDDGQDLNDALSASAAVVREAGPVVDQLAAQRRQVARLVEHFGTVMRALGERGVDLRTVARRSPHALEAFAAEQKSVAGALSELPDTLEQARASANVLARFGNQAVPVIRDLRISVARLGPLTRDLQPAARQTRRALDELPLFARRAAPTAAALRRFSRPGAEALPALGRLLRQYNPFVEYLGNHVQETGTFLSMMRSVTNMVDRTGNVARIQAVLAPSTVAGFTPELDAIYQRLRELRAIEELAGPHYVNPYPESGTIDDPGKFRGNYPRIRPDDADGRR